MLTLQECEDLLAITDEAEFEVTKAMLLKKYNAARLSDITPRIGGKTELN